MDDIYHLIEDTLKLDTEDYKPQSPSSDTSKWKRNIRNVLKRRKRSGDIQWDEHGKYKL